MDFERAKRIYCSGCKYNCFALGADAQTCTQYSKPNDPTLELGFCLHFISFKGLPTNLLSNLFPGNLVSVFP